MRNILSLYWNLFGNELSEKSLEIILINVHSFVVLSCEEGKEKSSKKADDIKYDDYTAG